LGQLVRPTFVQAHLEGSLRTQSVGRAEWDPSTIDHTTASRLGMSLQDIDSALNNASHNGRFQRSLPSATNTEWSSKWDPRYQRDPRDLSRVFVPGQGNAQVPPAALVKPQKTLAR
jgi:multidrug efflux pump